MEPTRIQAYKIQAIKNHKRQQLLNDIVLYSLTTLTCTSFCSSPLWYPPFCATFNVLFFFSLPKITSFFFTSKVLFIVGNLIVIFLLGESKFFASKSKDYSGAGHDTYECNRLDQLQVVSRPRKQKGTQSSKDSSEQEMQVKAFELRTCESTVEEEFFESYGGEGTYESTVEEKKSKSSGHEGKELRCSKGEVRAIEEEKDKSVEGDDESSLPTEELNKLVDDFIAKIIRQRRLEVELCRC